MTRATTSRLVHLFHVDADRTRREFLAILRRHRGLKRAAAEELGIELSTYSRWIQLFGVRDEVDALVAEMKESGAFPTKLLGTRPWEAVGSNGERLGTYATEEAAIDRARLTRGAKHRPRQLTRIEEKRARKMAETAREHNARTRAAKKSRAA